MPSPSPLRPLVAAAEGLPATRTRPAPSKGALPAALILVLATALVVSAMALVAARAAGPAAADLAAADLAAADLAAADLTPADLVPADLAAADLAPTAPGRAVPARKGPRFPAAVRDIDGNTIDVPALARDLNLVVVTLKAPWCPVCQKQLLRLKPLLAQLRACRVTFLVLSPGTPEQLGRIRERTGFAYPFVADSQLAIARSLGLAIAEDQILPCMLHILPDRSIGWRQLGRNGVYFGDGELKRYFDCPSV